MILPPDIRRVPRSDEMEAEFGDEGRFVAGFRLNDDHSFVRYVVHLPLTDDDPTLSELEHRARNVLKQRLQAIIDRL